MDNPKEENEETPKEPQESPVSETAESKEISPQPKASIPSAPTPGVKQIEQGMAELKVEDESISPTKSQEQSRSQSASNSKNSQTGGDANEQSQTKHYMETSRPNVIFGKGVLFPGSIEQFDISIGLKEEAIQDGGVNPYMLRVIAKCNNTEFNDLDQYVFSVRSNERFEYFEEVRFKIRKRQKAHVKVAVKIPPVKESYHIEGILEIQLQNLLPLCLPISAKCEVPQIICVKDLYKADEDATIIKVPAKKNQIRMPPIPFKNLSNHNITLEVEAITNENFSNRPYDIMTQNFVNAQANNQFFVNIQLKENMNYKGPMPTRDTIRKVLILKIKNSAILYNFPLEVTVFESTNATNSMS